MSGLAVAIAAVAAASLVLAADGRLAPAIISFRNDATVLQAPGTHGAPGPLVGELLALRGHGVTDLAAALRAAATQLATVSADERVVLLLSDCLPTAGGDPARALTGISRLHVLCPLPTATSEQAAAGPGPPGAWPEPAAPDPGRRRARPDPRPVLSARPGTLPAPIATSFRGTEVRG